MKRHQTWWLKAQTPLVLVLCAGVLLWNVVNPPTQTVVFDLQSTLTDYQDKLMEANLGDDAHARQLAQFDRDVRRILEDYAKAHHVTIVVPAAVISGAPDKTHELQRHIIDSLKASQQ